MLSTPSWENYPPPRRNARSNAELVVTHVDDWHGPTAWWAIRVWILDRPCQWPSRPFESTMSRIGGLATSH